MIKLLFVITIIFSIKAVAAPIAINCNSDGTLQEMIYPPSIQGKQEDYISSVISSSEGGTCHDCEKKCEETMKSSGSGALLSAVTAAAEEGMSTKNQDSYVKVSDSQFNGLKSANDIYQSDFFCSQLKAPKQSYDQNGSLALYYPNHTNYMYITGCSTINGKKCNAVSTEVTKKTIEQAVMLGVDPYVVLANGFMENGTAGAMTLYLDPVGTMDILGCKGRQLKNTEEDDKKYLNSFGTIFEIKEQVVSNSKLTDKIKKTLSHNGVSYNDEPSYLCRDVVTAGSDIVSKPLKDHCCLKMPFSGDKKKMESSISTVLTYAFAGKQLASKFRGQKDPAYNIQRFNGYTRLMGGAEGVPTFRAGLDFYKDPSYGYQAMDFILTSLASNPLVQEMVEVAKLKHGNYESAICKNLGEGKFTIDSDYYFNKHANAKRFEILAEKIKKGEKLTSREKGVLELELAVPEVAIALFGDGNALLYDQNKIEDKLKKRYGISLPDGKKEGFDSYIKHIELTSEQEKDQNLLNQLKPKYEQLSKLYERNKKNEELDDKLDSSLDNNLNQVTSLVAKYSPEGAGLDMGFSSLGFKDADDDAAAGLTETERVYAKIIQSVDKALPAASGKDKEKLVANKKYIQGSLNREREDVAIQLETEKIVDQVKAITGQSHKTEDDNGNDITYTFSVHENMFSSLEERIKVAGLTKKQLAHPGIASLLSDLKKSEEASHPEINNDTYKKYFKEIYSKRDTVSKASDYEWSRMSDASIEKIARKFKANSI